MSDKLRIVKELDRQTSYTSLEIGDFPEIIFNKIKDNICTKYYEIKTKDIQLEFDYAILLEKIVELLISKKMHIIYGNKAYNWDFLDYLLNNPPVTILFQGDVSTFYLSDLNNTLVKKQMCSDCTRKTISTEIK